MSECDYWNDTLGDDATQPYDEQEWVREWDRYLEDDEPICEETSFPLLAGFEEYKTDKVGAATLDAYLMYLIKGYMNATTREDLDLHIMELLEDEWFYQWPLVHWAYASRLLHGVGCRKSNKNKKKAVDILLPMARNGCPGALYDIGCCYMNGWHLEQSYVKAIYCWTMAYGKGYLIAKSALRDEYLTGRYAWHDAEIPVTLKYAFICANINILIEDHKITESSINKEFNPQIRNIFRKLGSEWKKLEKEIVAKTPLLMTADLFWDDENNPYKVTI